MSSLSEEDYSWQRFELLLVTPAFQEKVRLFRKKWNIPENGMEQKDDVVNQWIKSTQKRSGYPKDIETMLREFKLALHYKSRLIPYLLFGKVSEDDKSSRVSIFSESPKGGTDRLYLEIFRDTRLQDIQEKWLDIELQQVMMFGRPERKREKAAKNFERDKRIYELKCLGKKSTEIGTIIKEEFGGRKLCYDEVNKIHSKMQKRVNMA